MPLSNYQQLLILVCLAAMTAGLVAGTAITWRVHAALRGWLTHAPARERAQLLLALRSVPAATAVIAACGVALTFVRHEPAETTEAAGLTLMSIAACTLVLGSVALRRVTGSAWRTYQCHRLLRRHGQRIDVPGFPLPAWRIGANFPVAAVSGVLRPRLILSSPILDHCTADELAVIVRHEEAHARRRDNLCRACLLAMPDLISLLGGDAISNTWQRAVEEAADDEAVRSDGQARITLAGALVRVGRMASTPPPSWMPALALYDGDNLESRVRRLLTPVPPTATVRLGAPGAVGIAVATASLVAWAAMGPRPLHGLMEWAVRYLP